LNIDDWKKARKKVSHRGHSLRPVWAYAPEGDLRVKGNLNSTQFSCPILTLEISDSGKLFDVV